MAGSQNGARSGIGIDDGSTSVFCRICFGLSEVDGIELDLIPGAEFHRLWGGDERSVFPAAGMGELEEKLPGLAGHMEPDNPGMHTTDTSDFE